MEEYYQMKDKSLISVIVPVYNAEKNLSKCVNSILEQTYDNIEIILVNDGSKDNSLELCNEYKTKHSNVYVVDKANEGAGEARNAGLKIATGEYVMFIDSDDWIEPEMFSFLVSLMATESDIDTSICNYYIEGVNGESRVKSVLMDIPEKFWITKDVSKCISILDDTGKFNYLWNRLYKKSIIDENKICFEKQFVTGEDLDFNLKYFRHVHKCAISNKPMYHYIKDGVDSLCARYKDNLYCIVTELSQRRYELYNDFGMLKDQSYKLIYERTYVDYIRSCIPNMYRSNAPLKRKDRLKQMKQIFNDTKLIEYIKNYNSKDRISKVFSLLLKIGSPRLAMIVYSILFYIRNNHSDVYQKIK